VNNKSSWRWNLQLKTSEQFMSPWKWHAVIRLLVPDISRDCTAFIFEVLLSKEIDSMNQLTLKMRAPRSLKIMASIYKSTWHKMPKTSAFSSTYQNFKPHSDHPLQEWRVLWVQLCNRQFCPVLLKQNIFHYTARLWELSIISQYPSSFTAAAVLLLFWKN
jgi:hypothetical protein